MAEPRPQPEHVGPVVYRIAHAQWVQALLDNDYRRADFWRTQLEKLRGEVD